MLTTNQHRRIARTCANAVTSAIDTLPKLLQLSEPEVAAAIVADLAKACMGAAVPEPDPGAALAEVLRRVREEDDEEQVACQSTADFSATDSSDAVPSLPNS